MHRPTRLRLEALGVGGTEVLEQRGSLRLLAQPLAELVIDAPAERSRRYRSDRIE
jgi:hypothetical protein